MPPEFDRYSADYETAVERAIGFARQPHDVYLEAKVRKLLELARSGGFARHLSGRVASLHGVDVSGAMVELAREAVPEAEFRVTKPGWLPYEDGLFDLAYAVCVLHHVARYERGKLLSEMARVTRHGGLVVVFEHNPWNPLTRRVVRDCDFDEAVELLTRSRVSASLRAAGLEVTDAEYLLFTPWPRAWALERGLSWVPLGAQHVVAARA
jgi:SAM-dependent methyltransferase